jgi:apolipoprotein N-acyltransferase
MVDSAAIPSSTPVKPLYLMAAASGVLLYASFFPLNLGFLIWVALVPLFFLIRSDARPRHVYLAAFCGGLLFYVPAVQWMRVAHPAMYATWLLLSIICAAYFPLGLYLIRRLDRAKIPLPLAVPTVWVALEYFRAHAPTGFSWMEPLGIQHRVGFGWYFLGYTQHDCLPIIQIADIAGVYGVSLLIVLVNTVVFLWIARVGQVANLSHARPAIASVVVCILIGATLAYGYSRLNHPAFEKGPRVAMLQSNLPQSVKMGRGGEVHVKKHMLKLLDDLAQTPTGGHPDLIVWPETTFDDDWFDAAPGIDPNTAPPGLRHKIFLQSVAATHDEASLKKLPKEWQDEIRPTALYQSMAAFRTNHLLGLNAMDWEGGKTVWKYNSAKFIGSDGRPGPRYDKMHLVPFGEYVPLRNTFPWMKTFTPYTGDYSCKPGEHWTRFPLPVGDKTYHFGCIICYEDTDPALARRYVLPSGEGPPVDFLINISNDGWFDGTEEHEQHLAMCRFRAIECRRSVVRAVNMGISGVIDADGRVVALPDETWAKSKKVAIVVTANVPIDCRTTIYSRWGDWLPIGCWLLLIASLVGGIFFRSRSTNGVVLDQ